MSRFAGHLLGVFALLSFAGAAALAQTLTPATGGGAIPADNVGGAYASLTGPIYSEATNGDVGVGTIVLNAPAGFIFDVGGTAPTVLMNRIGGGGSASRNINGLGDGSTISVTTTSTTLSITILSASNTGVTCRLTWQNVRVRPTTGIMPNSGNITKSGTSTMVGVTNGVTNFGTLTMVPGAASRLTMNMQPSASATAGVAFTQQPVIRVEDQFGNLRTSDNSTNVTAARNLGTGVLQGTTLRQAASGLVTYTNLAHNVADTINIRFTSGTLDSVTSSNIVISPAAANKLTIQTQPSPSVTAGVAFLQQPIIRIEDQFGNLRKNDTTTVSAARSGGSGTLQGTLSRSAVGGIVTYTNLYHNIANTITIQFTSGSLTSATSNNVVVNPTTATRIFFSTQPASATAGSPFGTQPVVRTRDVFGNLSSVGLPASLNLTVSIDSGSGPLQGTSTLNIGSTGGNGTAAFTNLRIDSAGTKRLRAQASGFTDTLSSLFSVVPAAANKLTIQMQPSPTATAGQAFGQQPIVRIEDQFGNLRTNDTLTVTASRSAGTGTLQGTTNRQAVGGVVTYTNLAHNVADSITLLFSRTGLVSATSNGIVVSPTTATRLAFTIQPGAATAGALFGTQPVIRTQDQFGNNSVVGLSANLNVTMALKSGTGPLQGTSIVDIGTAAGNGIAAFTNLRIDSSGTKRLRATATGMAEDSSNQFTVNPAAASRLTIQAQPGSSATAGVSFLPQPVVRIEDQFGNLRTGDNTTQVTAQRLLGTGTLQGTTTRQAASGIVTYTNLFHTVADTINLKFTSGVLDSATSTDIIVDPAPASRLTIETEPSPSATAGVAFVQQPVIRVEDQFGNLRREDNSTVVGAKVAVGTGPLQGTTNATASSGVATFTNLANNVANTIRLRFTSASLDSATSDSIVVAPAAADRLVFTTQPGNATVYSPFGTQPVVRTRDQFGNNSAVSLPETLSVLVDLTSGSGALQGTTTLGIGTTQGNGVVTYTNLRIDSAGTNKQLTATAAGMLNAVSGTFTVSNTVPATTSIEPSTRAVGDTGFTMTVNGTNLVPTATVRIGGSSRSTAFVSPTQLTAQILASDIDTAGTFSITVVHPAPGGGTSNAQTLTVNNPLPTLAALYPASANRLDTLFVGFSGTNFVPGFSSVNVGSNITVLSTTVHSSDSLTARLRIQGTAATGARNFSVTNSAPGGGTSGNVTFNVSNPPPTLATLSPTSGNRLQTMNVVLKGTKFIAAVTQADFGPNITVNTVTVNSDTQITANISIQSTAATGARTVRVTNPAPGGGIDSLAASFTVNNPAPTVTSATPSSGERFQTLGVVLKGTNFITGVSSVSFGSNIAVNSTTVNSDTQITANITIDVAASTGSRNVVITNAGPVGGSATLTNGFTVTNPSPTLASLLPNTGNRLQTLDVALKGTKYITGVSSVSFGPNITVNATTVNSDTQITANISIGSTAAAGSRNVSVTNATPGGGTATLVGGFSVGNPSPTIVEVNPATGTRLQTLNVVIKGTKFIAGTTTSNFGSGITVNSNIVNSDSQLTANITIAGTASGFRNVIVSNAAPAGGADTLVNGFSILNPAPSTTRLSPSAVNRLQTVGVTVTGTNFIDGVSSVNFGPDITINSTTVNSTTQMTVNITVGASAATGQRDIIILNAAPGGGSDTLRKGLAVFLQTQTVLLSPSGDGGFESGSTFAANGWTIVNGSQWNRWALGTATKDGGRNAAYVSNDGGSTNTYTTNDSLGGLGAISIVHMYRDITFPPGETGIRLTFDWKGMGEGFFDNLRVFLVPTSTTPSAGTELLSGAIGQAYYADRETYTGELITLHGNNAGTTRRLVFTWKNDATTGTQPPVAIDNISLTSQIPTPLTGTKIISTLGSDYTSFTAAINDLNLNGVGTGGVTFNVVAGQTFREDPPVILVGGTSANPIRFQRSGGGANPVLRPRGTPVPDEAGFTISGGDYFTFDGIDVVIDTGTTLVEYGFLLRNASSTDGAQNNTIRNCRIALNRLNTSSRGILLSTAAIGGGVDPSSAAGANSHNKFYNITIEDVYAGIHLIGNATWPDENTEIGVTPGGFTVIGAASENNIGFGSAQTYGIRAMNQKAIKIFHCEVRNILGTSVQFVDGILIENGFGSCEVYDNKVHDLGNLSSTAGRVVGIRVELAPGAANSTRVYNNFVYGINSASTNTVGRRIAGILAQSGGGSGARHNVYFNTVRIAPAFGQVACQNTCMEIGTIVGPIMDIRNNIFTNFTGSQTGNAKHYAIATPGDTSIGPAGSIANGNVYYIHNTTNGFVGITNTTDRATLANWKAAFNGTQDTTTISKLITFVSSTNLHLISPSVGDVDLLCQPIAGITKDIDGEDRDAQFPYRGADEVPEAPLPITLASFTAQLDPNGRGVQLEWMTISEINNYGFFIQRKADHEIDFADIPQSFIPGHGTTIQPQYYSYLDTTLTRTGRYHYRLRQVDLDGRMHHTHSIMIDVLTLSVGEGIPHVFKVFQNYPNPFNPRTTIQFSVAKPGRATVIIYNILGQEVLRLFDGEAVPGQYYKLEFDARNLASGAYFYRVTTTDRADVKKMLLLK